MELHRRHLVESSLLEDLHRKEDLCGGSLFGDAINGIGQIAFTGLFRVLQ